MKQMSLGSDGFERYGKTTKRAAFLVEMDQVVPWSQLCALIEPHYPSRGGDARRCRYSVCCAFTSCSTGLT